MHVKGNDSFRKGEGEKVYIQLKCTNSSAVYFVNQVAPRFFHHSAKNGSYHTTCWYQNQLIIYDKVLPEPIMCATGRFLFSHLRELRVLFSLL